ncbi:F-BAR and double SH3 domains protein 2-like isoform X2 [Tachypleus tridentatus]|uniref:F-BAR and double SH3 domains protein 2-like isoform X2 n=1 Tax=Tachypleus tridentatus TaxID=6853 RepID=UPI003FD1D464
MQPPPRKTKAVTSLRNIHNEQITKLQAKHQQDADLLEDIRNFMKTRANIEKEYGQALAKLANSYLQRKVQIVAEIKSGNDDQQKTVYTIWKTLLDETDKIAQAKLAAVDVYQEVSEKAKALRGNKLMVSKKCFDSIRKMHEELQQCVQEVDKTKKLYFEEEHMAHGAREKAHDAEEKLKRKKGRIFQSISSLQRNSAKFSSRKEACDIQATKARNDYILALVAANAHLSRFYEIDLVDVIQNLDCDIYDKIKEFIQLVSRTELFTCAAWQSSFSNLQRESEGATKDYTMDCFLNDNPVLLKTMQYSFEPCDGDEIIKISTEHNAGLCLTKEARRWASCIAKESRTARDCYEELNKLQSEFIGKEKSSVSSSGEKTGTETDPYVRIEEIREIIRKAETGKAKAEARIEALREGEVNVDEWLKNADVDSLGPYNNLSRTGSKSSRSSQRSSRSEAYDEANSRANDSVYDSDFNSGTSDSLAECRQMSNVFEQEDVAEVAINAWEEAPEEDIQEEEDTGLTFETNAQRVESYPGMNIRCTALFTYEAANPDELSFVEQEELWIVGEGDGDGWVKARNCKDEEGYIPQNYVEIVDGQNFVSSIQPAPASFTSVDYTTDSFSSVGNNQSEEFPEVFQSEPDRVEIDDGLPLPSGDKLCQALYDYEATCDEELTFLEGQIIRILKKVVHDVDDGWWEGQIDGNIGIFPSLVVKEIKTEGESQTPSELTTPTDSAPPPAFTPPKPQLLLPPAQVILTQPTPETEAVETGSTSKVSILYHDPDFQLELTQDQQQQYNSQFSASESESSEQETPGRNYAPLMSSPESPPRVEVNQNKGPAELSSQKLKNAIQQPDIVVEVIRSNDKTVEDQDNGQVQCSRTEEDSSPTDQDDVTDSSVITYRSAEDFEKEFQEDETENVSQNGDIIQGESGLPQNDADVVPEKDSENNVPEGFSCTE